MVYEDCGCINLDSDSFIMGLGVIVNMKEPCRLVLGHCVMASPPSAQSMDFAWQEI